MVPFMLLTAAMTYVWPNVTGLAGAMVVAIIYGFDLFLLREPFPLTYLSRMACGVYVSQFATPIIHFGNRHDVGRRTGVYMLVLAAGALIGPPISGAINLATNGFELVGVYAGTSIVIASVAMWGSKCVLLNRFWGRF